MKSIARSLVVVLVALIAVPALVVSATITTAVQLLAATVLVLGGTGHSLGPGDDPSYVIPYLGYAVNNFIDPGGTNTVPTSTDYHVYAVTYPAEFFPVSGSKTFDASVAEGVSNLGSCLDSHGALCPTNPAYSSGGTPSPSGAGEPPYIVFGYSQSAVVASLVKNQLINDPTPDPALNGTTFYLISNPMRPNGGILGRGFQGMTIPLIGITFYGPTQNSCPTSDPCTPTDTGTPVYPTVDVAQQYDFLGGDAPARPLNLLAMANSLAAYALLHGDVPTHTIGEPGMIDQGKYGDTQYYLITAQRLPILMPLSGVVPDPILAVVDAPLRVLIEDAYVRDVSPGQQVTFKILPIGDPVKLAVNLAASIPVGIDDGLQEAGVGRALGTNNVYRPFGVGGQTYDKTTGNPAGVETWGNVFHPPTAPVAPNPAVTQTNLSPQGGSTPNLKIVTDPVGGGDQPLSGDQQAGNNQQKIEQLGNVPDQPETPVEATTPKRPLQVVRDSLNFDPTKHLPATRPSGDGPLKRIVGALTGQKPDTSTEEKKASTESPAA